MFISHKAFRKEIIMIYKVLSINPGSTSTKIALYENETELFCTTIRHKTEELTAFAEIADQYDFRKDLVIKELEKSGYKIEDLSAVVGRGGLFPNIKSGGYIVNDNIKKAVFSAEMTPHASNLGSLVSKAIADQVGIPAYVYDCVSSDEMESYVKITGLPDARRVNTCHVLNTKAMGRKYAEEIGAKYEDLNLVIAHLGGGITVSAHEKGRIADQLADDEGPFSPERAGAIPMLQFIKLAYSGNWDAKEMSKRIRGNGGLKAYFGTSDCQEIEKMIEAGDDKVKEVYDAMAYNVAKGIGTMSPALRFKVDAVIITGGIAYSKYLTQKIVSYLGNYTKIVVMPGENEMESLTFGALRILRGEEVAQEY